MPDTNPFGTTVLPGNQLDMAAWNPEVFRKETDQVVVSPAINGRGGQPDFQAIPMTPFQRVFRSPGLNMDGQHQVFTVPMVPLCSQSRVPYPGGQADSRRRQDAGNVIDDGDSNSPGNFTSYAPISG
jgi:hypothetical protein